MEETVDITFPDNVKHKVTAREVYALELADLIDKYPTMMEGLNHLETKNAQKITGDTLRGVADLLSKCIKLEGEHRTMEFWGQLPTGFLIGVVGLCFPKPEGDEKDVNENPTKPA